MAEKSLFSQVDTFWNSNGKLNKQGLVLLDKIIRRVVEVRDWDALARFISRSGMDQSKVGRIVRAAFGDALTYKKDVGHKAGGVIKLGWKAEDGFVLKNTYAHVMQAIEQGKAFNDAELQKAIKPAKKEQEKPAAELLEAYKKRAEAWAKEHNISMSMLIATLSAKPTTKVVKEVINGLEVSRVA